MVRVSVVSSLISDLGDTFPGVVDTDSPRSQLNQSSLIQGHGPSGSYPTVSGVSDINVKVASVDTHKLSFENAVHEDRDPHSVGNGRSSAGNFSIFIIIAKCFFGSAFLVVPNGMKEGGVLGGGLMLLFIFLLEMTTMQLIVVCRERAGPGYKLGDMGSFVGPWFVGLINFFVNLTCVGFIAIWIVTNCQNAGMVLPHLSHNELLWAQLPLAMPLVLVRKLEVFVATNIIGIVLCVGSVVYLLIFGMLHIKEHGVQPVPLFNTKTPLDDLLWLGSCAYVYEGVNMIVPIYDAAKDKAAMPRMLFWVTFAITALYISFGAVFYMAFGADVKSLATGNLGDSIIGKLMPGGFVFVGLFTMPINGFVISDWYERKVRWSTWYRVRKWQKNFVREAVLVATFTLTWLGGQQLQNFLALVGGFGGTVVAIIVPAVLHLQICKPGPLMRALDYCLLALGLVINVVATASAIITWKV